MNRFFDRISTEVPRAGGARAARQSRRCGSRSDFKGQMERRHEGGDRKGGRQSGWREPSARLYRKRCPDRIPEYTSLFTTECAKVPNAINSDLSGEIGAIRTDADTFLTWFPPSS